MQTFIVSISYLYYIVILHPLSATPFLSLVTMPILSGYFSSVINGVCYGAKPSRLSPEFSCL